MKALSAVLLCAVCFIHLASAVLAVAVSHRGRMHERQGCCPPPPPCEAAPCPAPACAGPPCGTTQSNGNCDHEPCGPSKFKANGDLNDQYVHYVLQSEPQLDSPTRAHDRGFHKSGWRSGQGSDGLEEDHDTSVDNSLKQKIHKELKAQADQRHQFKKLQQEIRSAVKAVKHGHHAEGHEDHEDQEGHNHHEEHANEHKDWTQPHQAHNLHEQQEHRFYGPHNMPREIVFRGSDDCHPHCETSNPCEPPHCQPEPEPSCQQPPCEPDPCGNSGCEQHDPCEANDCGQHAPSEVDRAQEEYEKAHARAQEQLQKRQDRIHMEEEKKREQRNKKIQEARQKLARQQQHSDQLDKLARSIRNKLRQMDGMRDSIQLRMDATQKAMDTHEQYASEPLPETDALSNMDTMQKAQNKLLAAAHVAQKGAVVSTVASATANYGSD